MFPTYVILLKDGWYRFLVTAGIAFRITSTTLVHGVTFSGKDVSWNVMRILIDCLLAHAQVGDLQKCEIWRIYFQIYNECGYSVDII